jgi:glycosyltransferase involved in cell wall biosynthesis
MDLLKKHPFTFITLARQIQSELVAKAYQQANNGDFDVVHIYTNEEEIALPFAALCTKPVVFTHHDPFNFLVKYKNNFPKYKHLNWLSMSYAQRKGMPEDTNWVGNIYHGLNEQALIPVKEPTRDYVAFLGRIIEPKGVHLAIDTIEAYNKTTKHPLTLKIAGKHYAEESKDAYWHEQIEPRLGKHVEYVGFIETPEAKRDFLGNAKALLVPSLFDEPFGMVTVESFACGTPVIALDSGALPEVIENGRTGYIVEKSEDDTVMTTGLAQALNKITVIKPEDCREAYETRFTLDTMVNEHIKVYSLLTNSVIKR